MAAKLNEIFETLAPAASVAIDFEQWLDELQTIIRSSTNGEYQIDAIQYKGIDKNGMPFGFSQGYPAFCHNAKMVGTSADFKTLCDKNELFMIHSYPDKINPGCRFTTWFCPIDFVNDKTLELITQYGIKAMEVIKERLQSEAQEATRQKELAVQEVARQKTLKEILGDVTYRLKKTDEDPLYGGHLTKIFEFSYQITKKQFVEFLKYLGFVTEAKSYGSVLPISPEYIEIYTIDAVTWTYAWHGEWDC